MLFNVKKTLLILVLFCIHPEVFSQDGKDSVSLRKDSIANARLEKKKIYSGPRKASIMSAILPGLGQAYNRKIWKIPIIYAGLGGFGYLFVTNNQQYNYYRQNLIAANDDDPNTVNQTQWDSQALQTQKISYRKSRDVAAMGFAIMYILNIIDANVDAHLKTFDVSDDLSIRLSPWQNSYLLGNRYHHALGLSITLNIKK